MACCDVKRKVLLRVRVIKKMFAQKGDDVEIIDQSKKENHKRWSEHIHTYSEIRPEINTFLLTIVVLTK